MSIGIEEDIGSMTKEQRDEVIEKGLAELRVDSESAGTKEEKKEKADDKTEQEETPVGDEKDSADESAADEEVGDEEAQPEEADDEKPEWLDEAVVGRATAAGITQDQIAEFESRKELDRALDLLDRQAMQVGKTKYAEEHKEGQGEKAAEPPPAKAEAEQKPPEKRPAESRYQVKLDPDIYQEEVKEFNDLRDHYEEQIAALQQDVSSRIERLEQADQERAAQVEQERFDAVVDTLGQADLFGEAGKESEKQLANRQRLFEVQRAYGVGLLALGRKFDFGKDFIVRAMRMEFADDLSKQQKQQLTKKLKSQSARKLGHGTTTSKAEPFKGPIEDDPELHAYYDKLAKESV